MTDISTNMPSHGAPEGNTAVAGRSLWQDAWIRLRRNHAAVASAVVLIFLSLVGIFGPMVSPHPYEKIYPQFVRVAPSLEAYPRADTIIPGLEREMARARLKGGEPELAGSKLTIDVTSSAGRELDQRVLRYFERSDLFSNPSLELAADKLSGKLSLDVARNYFFFGTDNLGRDMMTRTFIGVRISLAIGLLASVMALVLGVSYGAISGYLGGRADNIMMRIVDILYSLPFIFFVILMLVFFGRSIIIIFIAIGATEWLDMARIVRGQTLSLKRQEFVQAAEALGATRRGIITRHIIPNALGPVIVFVTLLVPKAILLESLLSFLGLGVQDPMTSLGLLISEGAQNMRGASWQLIFPAVTLTLILFALNFLGDGLRDSLDPKDR
ncbi:oligopeptide transport system permease protein [Pseudochrobactrum saccharolyticum]|uniref:Oligopeptide transport system permease protein OppC n=2 Tax=Pseudochrobactrum saccharolyticum TaxID=354352 RepID=A0A7W8AJI1_9HYPH|nr:ABC transporter permease subunit [Pseudochrobactrum saccharolyticum]KAB0538152.1 ABC transporter permease subunit [Pseudochrobactrum saccharolyticum]MBB5091385.1 oligopeptide transport system permease protein [Pseudochrobactrum saccharolyticum]